MTARHRKTRLRTGIPAAPHRGRPRRRPRRRARSRRPCRRRGRFPATWISTSTGPNTRIRMLDFHRFVLLFNHSFSDRLRFIGELELEHAPGRRPRGIRRAGAGTGVPGLPGEPGVQPARRDAARTSGDHQRAARTPVVSRRRAAVRRHVHHPNDVVRCRRRRFTARSARRGITARI